MLYALRALFRTLALADRRAARAADLAALAEALNRDGIHAGQTL
jgi:hypothetical protein